jgi:hypothetical protein
MKSAAPLSSTDASMEGDSFLDRLGCCACSHHDSESASTVMLLPLRAHGVSDCRCRISQSKRARLGPLENVVFPDTTRTTARSTACRSKAVRPDDHNEKPQVTCAGVCTNMTALEKRRCFIQPAERYRFPLRQRSLANTSTRRTGDAVPKGPAPPHRYDSPPLSCRMSAESAHQPYSPCHGVWLLSVRRMRSAAVSTCA